MNAEVTTNATRPMGPGRNKTPSGKLRIQSSFFVNCVVATVARKTYLGEYSTILLVLQRMQLCFALSASASIPTCHRQAYFFRFIRVGLLNGFR